MTTELPRRRRYKKTRASAAADLIDIDRADPGGCGPGMGRDSGSGLDSASGSTASASHNVAAPPRPRPRCTLVGAGPGDPELLTLKAVRAIRAATVLLVDDLVSDAVVRLARRRARIVRVGKRGGRISTPQSLIERMLVVEALKGERVVRLKGGDPFVFGRGGEEAEALRAHGIEVEVVNGITSGLAAATSLGVPLTHRDHAHGVVFVTGHAKKGGAPLDWGVLGAAAAQGLTLVVYMGMEQAATLRHGLLPALPAATPVAVVQHASLASERRCCTTLGELTQTIERERLGSPAVIIVGDVLRGAAALHSAATESDDDTVAMTATAPCLHAA